MTINLRDVINYRYQNPDPPDLDDGNMHLIQEQRRDGVTRQLIDGVEIKTFSYRTPEEEKRVLQWKFHEEPWKPFIPERGLP